MIKYVVELGFSREYCFNYPDEAMAFAIAAKTKFEANEYTNSETVRITLLDCEKKEDK